MTRAPSRRAVLGWMAALHTLALARIAQAQTPLPPRSGPLTPEGFLALSQRLTGHDTLSASLGERILAVLQETGQADALQNLYDAISEAPQTTMPDGDILQHILHGWYLGRVTIDDQTHLTGYEDTLMGRVTADILPLRSYCGGAMGFWADPPETGPLPLRETRE